MIIFAVNINSGGGLILLKEALTSKKFGKVSTVFIDERCPIDQSFENIRLIKVKPSLISRFKAEFQLSKMVKKNQEEVLFFGNLPSIFKIESKTKLFLQNAYILRNVGLPRSFYLCLRCLFERAIFYLCINKIDEVIVQTEWMRTNLSIFIDNKIVIIPFHPTSNLSSIEFNKRSFDIICISGPEEHKNLGLLIEALNEISVQVRVCIIANTEFAIKNKKVEIKHFKLIKHIEALELIADSKYLLLLSEFESYCLPYYEGINLEVKIIAPDKGYAARRDIELKKLGKENILASIKQALSNKKEVE